MAHAGAAGSMFTVVLTFPLLWLGLGSIFILVALRDRGGGSRRPEERVARPPSISDLREHPLRQVHVALAASKAASRKARERGPVDGARGGPPPERRPRPALGRRGGRHIKRVV